VLGRTFGNGRHLVIPPLRGGPRGHHIHPSSWAGVQVHFARKIAAGEGRAMGEQRAGPNLSARPPRYSHLS
jgi:hypothetical protein